MVFLMASLSVCCYEFDLDQLMVSSLDIMKVLYLVKHLDLLKELYLVNMIE